MRVSQATISHLEDFNRYAKFISDKFGIEVRFDTLKAQTDGKVIYLPSLAGMSDEEVDFLYCVLLHEVGHIRYTNFAPEAYKTIKSQSHFHICNALEDARIENSLMKDFDGAHDIFLKLYNEYAANDDFMHRVFGIKGNEVSVWHAIGIYAHDYFVDLDKKNTLKDMVGEKIAKQVAKFIQDHKIDQLFAKTDLKTWDDVLKLGTKLYDLYFDDKKDKSDKLDISPMIKALEEVAQKQMDQLQETSNKMQSDLADLQEQAKKIEEKLREKRSQNAGEIEQLQAEQKSLRSQMEKIEDLEDARQLQQTTKDRLQKYETNKTELQNKQQSYEAKKAELEKKLQELKDKLAAQAQPKVDENGQVVPEEPKTPGQLRKDNAEQKKLQDLEKKLQTAQERLQSVQQRLKEQDNKINTQTGKQNEAQTQANKSPEELAALSNEELNKLGNETQKRLNEIYDRLEKLQGGSSADQQKLGQLRDQMNQIKDQASKEITDQLQKMQDKLSKAGLPIQVVPQFETNEAWPEGDAAQQQFDQEASAETGQLVANGCGFGLSNPRDIVTYIDQVKNDVVDFNLGEHFHEQNHESKLESFNEEDTSKITYTQDQKDSKTFKSNRKHTPLSTALDKVLTKNSSDGKEIAQIKSQLSSTITQVRNLFRNRLKFDKRDWFSGNQEEGKLDSRNLWKLATKTDDLYYEVNRPKFVNKVSATILVDISGSMDKTDTAHGEKLRELALILSEGLKEVHIQHEVIGYHAPVNHELRAMGASPLYNRNSNSLEHIVYKTFNDKNNLGIQNLEVQCSDNSDGESIKFAGQRLVKSRSKRKVLFVISDSKPFLSDANVELLDQDLRNSLEWCKGNKIEVFALGFNKQGKEFFGDRYGQLRDYTDLLKYIKEKL
jgi:cobalamin biosynthesis protein CobT